MKHYPLNAVDDYKTFYDLLHGIAEKYGDQPAITWYTRKGEKRTSSYRALRNHAFAFANMLVCNGYHGKHIAILSENSYAWLVAFLGIAISGNMAVCVDAEQPEGTIQSVLRETDIAYILASRANVYMCEDIDIPFMEIDEVLNAPPCTMQAQQEEMYAIFFTSGTTGEPKPVMLSYRGIVLNASESVAMVHAENTVFTPLPFHHAYGFTCGILGPFILGLEVCICENARTTFRDLRIFSPETVIAVPLIVEMIHKEILESAEKQMVSAGKRLKRRWGKTRKPKWKHLYNGSIRTIVCGGAYLADDIAQDLAEFGIEVLQGYGITECSPLITVNRNQRNQLFSVGLPLPSFSVRFEEDEIVVQGPAVMLGYYRDCDRTAAVLKDGWFYTGDIGFFDKHGFLHIKGRKKNLIVFKNGKKVAPEEIERYMLTVPLVKEVVAYGANSGISADDVKLAVLVYPDPQATTDMTSYEVIERLQASVDRINETLPAYKQIQMVNVCSTAFARTGLLKAKRNM